jgi:hypothetical protein
MLAATLLAVLVRVVAVTSPDARAHVVIAVDQQRTVRVTTGTAVDVGDAKSIRVVEPGGWWSPVVATSGKAEVEVALWPAAELKGRLTVEKGSDGPRELEATFVLKGERVTVACPVEEGTWTCRLPSTKLDLRLAANDFVPHYLWDVDPAKSGPVAIALKRGASVAGWVAAERDGASMAAVTVKLVPATYGEADDQSLLSLRTTANKRGFFQLTGVPAGRWIIAAEAADLSPSAIAEVEIDDRHETTLDDPLVLRDLATLNVSIQPGTYAPGVPWRVRLNRRPPRSRFVERVGETAASETGEWTHGRLPAGEYVVDVMNPRGAVYGTRHITVAPDMMPVQVDIERVTVRGKVHIGGDGIAAFVTFSSGRGETVRIASNDDGELTVDLPFEGKWRVDVRLHDTKQELSAIPPVTVARRRGEPYADIDLELPGGRVKGRVVDESGKAVKSGVILTRSGSILADIYAADGTFELVGVRPGPAMIEAQGEGANSGLLPVNIDSNASPVTLTLRRAKKLEGFVVTAEGGSVAGASIRFLEAGAAIVGEVVTSPTGRFVIQVNATTTAVRVAIAATGLPSKLALLRVPEKHEAIEVVLGRASGRLIVPLRDSTWPFVGRDGAWASALHLVEPLFGRRTAPRWATKDGMAIDLEPGEYTICPTHIPSPDCVTQVVAAGTTTIAKTP